MLGEGRLGMESVKETQVEGRAKTKAKEKVGSGPGKEGPCGSLGRDVRIDPAV